MNKTTITGMKHKQKIIINLLKQNKGLLIPYELPCSPHNISVFITNLNDVFKITTTSQRQKKITYFSDVYLFLCPF